MKNILLAGVCLFISYSGAVAQNKTLGVGVATPNPNAALHVESPTGNQGFMMPRLTTTQREAMASLLTDADKGLILYDSDLYSIFVWDGASWGSTSQFTVDDPASEQSAITVSSLGMGAAARFSINNTATFAHAIHAENNGDSTSAAVHGNHLGNGFGVFGKSAGSKFASAAVYGEHVGTGDAAGAFRISNTASTFSALFGETNGSGPAIFGSQKGTGRGGQFQITNTANSNAALRSYTAGTGNSGWFTINNTASTVPGILTTTNGSGAAIVAENSGAADGFAGLFTVTQSTNTYPAIQANSAGSGSGVRVIQDKGTGAGMDVFMQNTGSTAPGFSASHTGLGSASVFEINNVESRASSIVGTTNGSGYVLQAIHKGSNGDAIYAETASFGSAGNFRVSNADNSASAVFAATNGPSGVAIGANHEANGIAMTIWGGGVRVSTHTLSADATITTRASAYLISGGTSYSMGFTLNEGEIFYFFNDTINEVLIDKLSVAAYSGKSCIFLGGVLREL